MIEHKIKKVLLLGSGALKIGEAGEFDYSGHEGGGYQYRVDKS